MVSTTLQSLRGGPRVEAKFRPRNSIAMGRASRISYILHRFDVDPSCYTGHPFQLKLPELALLAIRVRE